MASSQYFRLSNRVLLVPFGLALLIWTVYMFELRLGSNFNTWGIYPRTLSGLKGILFSPWIHGSTRHLYNNTFPLVVLSAALFYFYRKVAWQTLLLGGFLTGLLTWVIGRPSYHIGASGLIYLLASFIFFKGIFSRHYRLVALSMIVVFIYGGMLWYVFPIKEGISWEGHLGGAISGFFLSLVIQTELPPKPKYSWEQEDYREEEDPFMRHFDADGNFIENPAQESTESPGVQIRYEYREKTPPSQDDS